MVVCALYNDRQHAIFYAFKPTVGTMGRRYGSASDGEY